MEIETVIHPLGFKTTNYVEGRSSIADLYKPKQRCGIYVLHFSNAEFYAGQAVDVTRRYIQHCKVHGDIQKISFIEIPAEELNTVERNVIWTLEGKGVLLRNISLTSIPKGESDFDFVMPKEDQEKWLNDLNFTDTTGSRPIYPDLRRKYERKYSQLLQKPTSEPVIKVLQHYAQTCIPAVKRGEVSFWSCSCLPGSSGENTIYSRINIYWQEVMTIFESKEEIYFSFHLAASPFRKNHVMNFIELKLHHYNLQVQQHRYKPGGQDQLNLIIKGEKQALKLIQNKTVKKAIRLFNLRLMQKGACMWNKNHCLALADRLLDEPL
jgi:hypothetical protein